MSFANYIKRKFHLTELYRQVWSYRALPFPASDKFDYNPPFTGTLKAVQEPFKKTASGSYILVPLRLSKLNESAFYELPVEVIVKVQGKQRAIKRYTHHLTNKGSIKEQWGMDDYTIDIRGLLFAKEPADSATGSFTANDANLPFSNPLPAASPSPLADDITVPLKRLDDFLREGLVKVDCPLLELFAISHMFIHDISWPFTVSGLGVVPFEIKAVSDFRQDELLEKLL